MKFFDIKNYLFRIPLLLSLVLFLFNSISANPPESSVKLTIDQNKTFQTIEGFGAFNTMSFWADTPYEEKYDFLANDMGLSIMRFELPPTFQEEKGGEYNRAGKVFAGPDLTQNFKDVRELHKRGVNKFIATIWSPPAYMKTLNRKGEGPTPNFGGSLREDMREEFANYCAAYCRVFKEETGVELYAIGLQNEPEFAQPFNSCRYNPEQMREALRYVGRKFKKDGISTKIYMPEALPAQGHVKDFFNAVNEDNETKDYADIFAIHNYDRDGMNVGGASAERWEEYAKIAASTEPKKQLWMTETSGHKNNWEGAMLLAANIYNALKYGNINAWVWWAISDKKSSEVYGQIIDAKPTGRYFVSKHFYRFVRPDALRIEAETDNRDILGLAFKNSGDYELVSVLINKGEGEQVVELPKVKKAKSYKVYLSSEDMGCELQKSDKSGLLTIPTNSIATVVWE